MKSNVGNAGGFMRQPDRLARAYVYDVTAIVAALEYQAPPNAIMHGLMGYQSLIDGFFNWALDSFEYLGVRDYVEYDYTTDVLNWYNQQDRARSLLWEIFSIEEQYSGHDAIVVRRKNTLWLFVLV